jgi:hypothetical protein
MTMRHRPSSVASCTRSPRYLSNTETNVGAEWEEIEVDGRKRQVLVAAGLKNWLIAPCNNAVFLKDVEVDWISVEGEGQTIPHGKVEREDLEALLKEREQQEALENLRGDEDG